jgi:hypothetical protein
MMARGGVISAFLLLTVLLTGAAAPAAAPPQGDAALAGIAESYVRLALAVGRHDDAFVDAYFGPPSWKSEAEQGNPVPLETLSKRSAELLAAVRAVPRSDRQVFLERQIVAVDAYLARLRGGRMTLADEARLLFDIDPPVHTREEFQAARARLEAELPGTGDLASRVEAFRARFKIPPDRLPAVVDAALAELRRRTLAVVALPRGETFEVRYVKGKPWGAYNWYKGNYTSLIEVCTDIPSELDGVLGVLAHEGYPGHHTYNALLEDRLLHGRGWVEYSVYPLFSPQSLIAEGTANAARGIVMSDDERRAFLRDVLAPKAGIDTRDLDLYLTVIRDLRPFRYAQGEAARMLLDQGQSPAEVESFLIQSGLREAKNAGKSLDFIRTYRAYVFNYTVGEDLVRAWVGEGPDRVTRFFELLQRPVVPSELVRGGQHP